MPTTSPGSTGSGSNLSPSCGVEGGTTSSPLSSNPRVGMNDMSGQLLDSSLAALSYPRLGGGMGLGGGMYGTSYPPSEQNPYPSLAMDSSSAFYGSLVSSNKHYGTLSKFYVLKSQENINNFKRGIGYIRTLSYLSLVVALLFQYKVPFVVAQENIY